MMNNGKLYRDMGRKYFVRMIMYLLAVLSLSLGVAHFFRVRTGRSMILRGVKAIAEGLSPFLALLGASIAAFGLLLHLPMAALAGITGALLQVRYIRHVTRSHHAFEDPFGENWVKQIETLPLAQRKAFLRQRWSWRMPRPAKKAFFERNMVYRIVPGVDGHPDTPLECDLWLPPERIPASKLAILYVHGGAYYMTAKDFGTRVFFRHLVSQGHMVMDINYRLAPQANLFDMLADVQHALFWLKDNADLFGIDPQRIVLAGGSAGAHLALLAAYGHNQEGLTPPELMDKDLSVCAVASYYGVVDLVAAYRRMQWLFAAMKRKRSLPENFFNRPSVRRAITAAAWIRGVEPAVFRDYLFQNQFVLQMGLESAITRLLGGSPEEIPEIYQLVSPLTYVNEHCPPTLLLQGAHDYLLPVEITRDLQNKLRAVNVLSVYVELPQTEHTFDQFLPLISPPAQTALYDLERFLAILPHPVAQPTSG